MQVRCGKCGLSFETSEESVLRLVDAGRRCHMCHGEFKVDGRALTDLPFIAGTLHDRRFLTNSMARMRAIAGDPPRRLLPAQREDWRAWPPHGVTIDSPRWRLYTDQWDIVEGGHIRWGVPIEGRSGPDHATWSVVTSMDERYDQEAQELRATAARLAAWIRSPPRGDDADALSTLLDAVPHGGNAVGLPMDVARRSDQQVLGVIGDDLPYDAAAFGAVPLLVRRGQGRVLPAEWCDPELVARWPTVSTAES